MARVALETPPWLDSAIAHGTRTRTGAPGPNYWQNGSDYDIQAHISLPDSLLTGDEMVTYHNNSPDTLRAIVFHLYQNLMGPYAARESPLAVFTHGMVIDTLQVGTRLVPVPAANAAPSEDSTAVRVFGTLMQVPLMHPLAPHDTLRFHVRWHFTIPGRYAPRMGMQDSTTAQIAQWYPQIAVYDDLHGWDVQQYTGTGEFYLDYGRFRYSVTLPAGFVVGGTGTLVDPQQVLTPAERSALQRAATTDSVVHVLTTADFGPGRATQGSAGSELTWTFTADSVRDVAFAFGDHYLWDATNAVVDSARHRTALVNVLYRQGAPRFDQVWSMARAALETHSSRMVPYPYPQLTESEGGSGGMEYPMTVFVGAYPGLYRDDEVTAHEIGHEWFPMMVGSNETRHGWQDEGLNTFDTFFATDAYLPDSMHGEGLHEAQDGYVQFVTRVGEALTMMAPANSFGVINSGYNTEAYDKPGATLWTLYTALGRDRFSRAYRAYIHRWAFKHPSAWDFFHTFDDVTGENLDPFWASWFFTRDQLDQAIAGVQQANGKATVTVENKGLLSAPIDVTATLANGDTISWRASTPSWYAGPQRITTSHAVPARVTAITLDAAHNYPDVDRTNNVWGNRP
ncbi:MAG TPA: M1 family metallopeptidase [Gemmatimonadaceae bacterium]|nr:M1 family metallopeptidase [Gemmatimonadaceae bacterium]